MIYILTTGGTIEGVDYGAENDRSNTGIANFLDAANVSFPYTIEEVFKVDSRSISQDHRESLANRIRASNSDKILITHGTFTMENTAQYLGQLKLDKTIVLTGSFVLGTSVETDAPFNLGYAISTFQFLMPGVYIAMNGQVFHWDNVTKNQKTKKFERKND